jgi:hypothetical protein
VPCPGESAANCPGATAKATLAVTACRSWLLFSAVTARFHSLTARSSQRRRHAMVMLQGSVLMPRTACQRCALPCNASRAETAPR